MRMLTYIIFLVGFVLLIKGADYLVEGASSIARRLRVSDLVVGLTVVAFGTSMPELFVNGQAMTLARWPNEEYARIATIVDAGSDMRKLMKEDMSPKERHSLLKGFAITVDSDRLGHWTEAEDPRMFGYWFYAWSDLAVQVKAIHPDSKTIESDQPSTYGIRVGQQFYVYNLLEELDKPGEWYLDRTSGILYFYPPDHDRNGLIQLSLYTGPLFIFKAASHIVLQNLSLGVTRGYVIHITDGEGILIKSCNIGPSGGLAVKTYVTGLSSDPT